MTIAYCKLSVHMWQHPFTTCVWSFILQIICYAKTCCNYPYFLYRPRLMTIRLQEQGFVATILMSSLQKFYACHHDFFYRYGASICTIIGSTCHRFPFLFRLLRAWLFMSTSGVFLEKQTAFVILVHLIHASGF